VLDELVEQKRADSHKLLAEAVASIQRSVSGVRVLPQLLEGWPKEAILDEAERWGADLSVVGSHGYGTFRRFFLGSVSMTVAMNATCSVLIVRSSSEAAPAGHTLAPANRS
jgi:nucleotide-binding universal stress UspA family protein